MGLEFADGKEQLNAVVAAAAGEVESAATWTTADLPPLEDVRDPRVLEALRGMQRVLGFEEAALAGEVTAEGIDAVASVLEGQVLPAAEACVAEDASSSGQVPSGSAAEALLARFPLGFRTGDPRRDVAATVLRLLFLKDLRELQTLVDDVLAMVQESTARSMANAAFGRPAKAS